MLNDTVTEATGMTDNFNSIFNAFQIFTGKKKNYECFKLRINNPF